jgi:superfamily I DNA/RNA helicase
MELREAAGRKYDWDDLAFYVFNELQDDDNERRYTHIIIDEGQDFSPMMIKSLIEAVADSGSFTFFGDVAQQIYGSRLSWRDSGVDTNKIWRFDVNYRNPATITAFAKAITENEYWRQDGDMVEATAQIAEGPKPILVKFSSKQHEMAWVVERAIVTGKVSSTAIVCRNRADIDAFLPALKNKDCEATEINKDTPGFAHLKKVYLTTYHAAKGLEFDNVFIPYLTEDKLPDPDTVSSAVSEEDVYADEIKLLYVAATRSKYGLYMTYSGTLSPLFPEDSDSYDFHNEEDVE